MDPQRSEGCTHPGSVMTCPLCLQSAISCLECFKLHCDSHSFMTTVDSQGRVIQVPVLTCNYDNNQASWFTADLLNVCDAHCEGNEVFPLDQAPVLTKFPEQGIEILRRARKIDQVCEELRNIPNELEQALTASIEKDFQSAMDALSKSKEKIAKDLQTELAELRSELENIIDALQKQKLEETIQTKGTWLEESVLALPLPEVQERLQSEAWLLYSCNRETLRSLEKQFCCIRRSGTLLDPPPAVCAWKDNYYCLPGSKFQIFEVLSGNIYDCGVNVQYAEGAVWTGLPDGSFFFCGNEMTTECKQLNSQYTEFTSIGRLQTPRSFAGIIHFEGSVYVFGGLDSNIPLKCIEAFCLHTRSSVTLPVQMQAPRSHFCPCVWNRQIFYGPGRGSNSIELFDPVGTICQITIVGFMATGSVLVAANEEEIVVLAADVIRYLPNLMRLESLTDENVNYYSPGGLVTNSGKAYFALRKKTFWSVQYLDERKKVVKVKDVYN